MPYARTAYDALVKVTDDAVQIEQSVSQSDSKHGSRRTSAHVRIEVWKAEFEAQCVNAAKITNAAMRMRFSRAVESLKSRNFIGFRKDEAWLI